MQQLEQILEDVSASLPKPHLGTYQLLILSHFQSRDEQATVDPALQKLLATYFEKPDDLLGRIKFDFGPLKVKGTGDVRDQSF